MRFKTFAPQGKALEFEFPPVGCALLHQRWDLWQDCVSASPTHFTVVFFFVQDVVVAQPEEI